MHKMASGDNIESIEVDDSSLAANNAKEFAFGAENSSDIEGNTHKKTPSLLEHLQAHSFVHYRIILITEFR